MRISILFICLNFFLQASIAQDKTEDYSEAFHLVDVWLEAQKDFEFLPSITAIVVKDQDVLWQGAFGHSNLEEKINASPQTLGSICSITKLFTSVAIMKLYDAGELRLDDRVEDILPGYTLPQKFHDSGPITIRSLLTHSSGLPREANFPYWTEPDFPFPSSAQIRLELANQETLYPVSTYFQYSNLGLTLLGEIVEKISGTPYSEFIQNEILHPLELNATQTQIPESYYGEELAIGYSSMTRKGTREKVKLFQAKGIGPAAGFASNVIDLGKFASWQFRLIDTTIAEVLKPSTLKNMYNIHWTDPDFKTTWGLGFSVYKGTDGKKWVGHGGSCPGYRSTLQLNPDTKMAFVVMINASGTNPGKYASGIRSILNQVLEDQKSDSAGMISDGYDDYTGYYSSQPWWGETYIYKWGEKLVSLSLPSDNPAEAMTFYKHIEGDTFRRIRTDDNLGETLIFERNSTGKVYRLKRHGNYSKKIDR